MKKHIIKWWKDWIEADCLDKEKKVTKLPALNELYKILKHKELDEESKKFIFFSNINHLFEDLYEECLYQEMLKHEVKTNGRRKNKKLT